MKFLIEEEGMFGTAMAISYMCLNNDNINSPQS